MDQVSIIYNGACELMKMKMDGFGQFQEVLKITDEHGTANYEILTLNTLR